MAKRTHWPAKIGLVLSVVFKLPFKTARNPFKNAARAKGGQAALLEKAPVCGLCGPPTAGVSERRIP